MKCWMMWYGGSSYSPPSVDGTEEFDTLEDMEIEFEDRAGGWNRRYPCVERIPPDEGGPEAWVFFSDPRESNGDPYPDQIMAFGPRGGLRREAAG